MRVATDPERYRSFLLRQWKEAPDRPWRYQVHCVATGDELRFADLEHLLAFLREAATGNPGLELEWAERPEAGGAQQGAHPGIPRTAYL